MRPGQPSRHHRRRSGTAIVAALGLMLLAAALLASSALVSFASLRATRAARAALEAEAIARRSAYDVISAWSVAYDSLTVGQSRNAAVTSPMATMRVQRLSGSLYAISVEGQAGVAPLRARRRLRVFVQQSDSGAVIRRVRSVNPLTRWGSVDLY